MAPPSHYTDMSGSYIFQGNKILEFPRFLIPKQEEQQKYPFWICRNNQKKHEHDGDKWLREAINKAAIGSRNYACLWLSDQLRDDSIPIEKSSEIIKIFVSEIPQEQNNKFTLAEALSVLKSRYSLPKRNPAKKN